MNFNYATYHRQCAFRNIKHASNKTSNLASASAPGRNSRNERPPRRGRASHAAGRNSETGIAALRLGRRFIGIELNPEYAAISERRLREAERNSIGDLFMPAAAHVQQGLFAMNGGVDGHNGHAQAEPVRR